VHEREEGLLPTLRSVFARRFKEIQAAPALQPDSALVQA
jgi:hypothetical protein